MPAVRLEPAIPKSQVELSISVNHCASMCNFICEMNISVR